MRVSNPPASVPGAGIAAFTSATIIALQVAGKAARDSLFLTHFSPKMLPYAMAGAAVLSLFGVLGVSRVMTRHSPARIVPPLFALGAVGLLSEWAIGMFWPRLGAVLVYLHIAFFGPITLSAFWSLINERFEPHTAKRAVARIAGGGTLGGVLGGLAAWRASALVGPAALLPFLALFSAAATVGVLAIRSRSTAVDRTSVAPVSEVSTSAFQILRTTPFLRNLGLLVAIGSASSAILDYVFSVQATRAYGTGQSLLAFFSIFWLVVGIVSFGLQTLFGRVMLEKLGLAVSVAVLPGIVILGGALGLALPGLPSSAIMRGGEAIQRNTLFRSAYELLYTPLPEAQKRTTKAFIDVGLDRVGTIVGSGLTLLAVLLLPREPATVLLVAVVVLSVLMFPVTQRLHVGYVKALQSSLREDAMKLEVAVGDDDPPPSSSNLVGERREALIERLESLKPGGLTALLAPEGSLEPPPSSVLDASVESAVRDMLSGDPSRIRTVLREQPLRGVIVGCSIPLLANPDLHHEVASALRAVADSNTGQLVDALLDRDFDFVIRRRIPQILADASSQRAADGLLSALVDHRFEVRYAAGRALMKITLKNPAIVISRPIVIETIRHEIEAEKETVERLASDFDDDSQTAEGTPLVDALIRDRVDRSLEHIFAVLSLFLEREPLRMAFRALHHEDSRFRGTALEYLDTVLPTELHDLVWPFLGEADPLPEARPVRDILAELENAATLDPVPG